MYISVPSFAEAQGPFIITVNTRDVAGVGRG
jgi:hypothetical protein